MFGNCKGTFDQMTGQISVSSDPAKITYPIQSERYLEDDAICRWTIIAPVNKTITLIFEDFKFSSGNFFTHNCLDYLAAYDGSYNGSWKSITPITGELCGKTFPSNISSSSNRLHLKLSVERSVEPDSEFKITSHIAGAYRIHNTLLHIL